MTTQTPTRVVIIGASLAGSMTAIHLGRAGVPTLLIDKATFPRRKPCGEGLSARGLAELTAIGCDLVSAGCSSRQLLGYRIQIGTRVLEIPETVGITAVSRTELDNTLLHQAAQFPTNEIIQGVDAKVRRTHSNLFQINLDSKKITTSLLVVADGAHSPTLRSLGYPRRTSRHPRLGTSSRWEILSGKLPSFVHTILVDGGEMYLTPLAGNTLNISVLGTRSLVQTCSRERTLRPIIQRIADSLGLSLSLIAPPIGSGTLDSGYRGATCGGAFIAGDACETFDPCSGFGMTHALLNGRLAAQHIINALGHSDISRELARYARCRERSIRDLRGFTRLTSLVMTHDIGRRNLPWLVRSGIVKTVSHAAHTPRSFSATTHLTSLVGYRVT